MAHLENEQITDYIDEALSPDQRAAVERHLSQCVECRRLIDDFREIRRVAGSLDLREPPARAWARLERAIAVERQSVEAQPTHARSSIRQWLAFTAAAAVLVIATAASLRYLMN